jgi:hypothetical protein
MAWEVEYTGEFESWWNDLTEEEQIELDAKVFCCSNTAGAP